MKLTENIWITLSFIVFIASCYKPAKRFLTEYFNKTINEIRNELKQVVGINVAAKNALLEIKEEYDKITIKSSHILEIAHRDAELIMQESERKIENMITTHATMIKYIEEQKEVKIAKALKNKIINLAISEIEIELTNILNNMNKMPEDNVSNISEFCYPSTTYSLKQNSVDHNINNIITDYYNSDNDYENLKQCLKSIDLKDLNRDLKNLKSSNRQNKVKQ